MTSDSQRTVRRKRVQKPPTAPRWLLWPGATLVALGRRSRRDAADLLTLAALYLH